MRYAFLIVTLSLAAALSSSPTPFAHTKSLPCVSPNGHNNISIILENGIPYVSVSHGSKQVLDRSPLGLILEGRPFKCFKIIDSRQTARDMQWHPVTGCFERIRDHYNGLVVELQEVGEESKRRLDIELRAYNEGVAFRYLVPQQKALDGAIVSREKTEFRFARDFGCYPINWVEAKYKKTATPLSQCQKAMLPLTVDLGKIGWACVFEAYVANQPPSFLTSPSPRVMQTQFRKGPVTLRTPWSSSWRGIMLAANISQLVRSRTIVQNLNPPCAIEDPSWIHPGKYLATNKRLRFTTENIKKDIDTAVEFGLAHLHLDWSWYGTEKKWKPESIAHFEQHMPDAVRHRFPPDGDWKQNLNGNPMTVAEGWVPYLQMRPRFYGSVNRYIDFDMREIIRYADKRGVGVSLYINGATIKPYGDYDMGRIFKTYHTWGVKTIKPGFVACSTQKDIAWLRRLIKTAAQNKLMLCIHDAYIADGVSRTWPHVLTVEGGGGAEGKPPVAHDLMLPFTRHLAGAHDYTPEIYSPDEDLKGRTKLYQVAQLVVFHGARQSIRRLNMDPQKVGIEKEFIKKVPTVWDDERILTAEPGNHIIIARRSKENWFIGGMNGETPRTISLKLDFLDKNTAYRATIYIDKKNSRDVQRKVAKVTSKDKLRVRFNSKGGCAITIKPI